MIGRSDFDIRIQQQKTIRIVISLSYVEKMFGKCKQI